MQIQNLQTLVFLKKYQKLSASNIPDSKGIQGLISLTIKSKNAIYQLLISEQQNKKDLIIDETNKYCKSLKEFFNDVSNRILSLCDISFRYFTLELFDNRVEEKQLGKEIAKFCDLMEFETVRKDKEVIMSSLYLSISFLEVQLTKIISSPKTIPLKHLQHLQKWIRQIDQKYKQAHHYLSKIMTIVMHLKLNRIKYENFNYEQTIQYCLNILIQDNESKSLLSQQSCTVVIYNILKYLMGSKSDHLQPRIHKLLSKLYEVFQIKKVENYQQHILHLFFFLKGLIFKNQDKNSGQSQQVEGEDDFIGEKLSIFLNINNDEIVVSLNQATRKIIRHRVASLSTLIDCKFSLQKFSQYFLELMHESPFNNEIQTIKFCFQLYEARQYSKLSTILSDVISLPTCKQLKQRQVLIALCSIFTGLHLEKRQEALLYAKLNISENRKEVLFQETLLQHLGFAYYNLAIHEIYYSSRKILLEKALQSFLKSHQINPKSYVLNYCISKIYLMMFDYDNAYKYAMQSCRCNRGEWLPFSLLACVYFCQRRITKSILIIDELIKKYPDTKLLFYMRAYLEGNKILLDVQHDEEVEAAKELDEEAYKAIKDKHLRGKIASSHFFKFCQQFYQESSGNVLSFQENSLGTQQIFNKTNLENSVENFIGYHQDEGQKSLLMILDLFAQIGLVNQSESILKSLPPSWKRHYFKAIIHELKHQHKQAILEYNKVLILQPYHTPSLINLSFLEEQHGNSLHLLNQAGKFVYNQKLIFAKGVVFSKIGRVKEANQMFLEEGELGWLEEQPDRIYIY